MGQGQGWSKLSRAGSEIQSGCCKQKHCGTGKGTAGIRVVIPELERTKPSSLAPVRAAAHGCGATGSPGKVVHGERRVQHHHSRHILHNWVSRSTNSLFKIQNYSFTHLSLHSAQGTPGSCCHRSGRASQHLLPTYSPSPSSPQLLLFSPQAEVFCHSK